MRTYDVPLITAGGGTEGQGNPALIAQAPANTYMRVLVRNITAGGDIVLSHDAAGLQVSASGGNTYKLPPGMSDVFVCAPGEKIYAASLGAFASCSVAVSPALPVDIEVPRAAPRGSRS